MPSETLRDWIKRLEGTGPTRKGRFMMYKDKKDIWTIGWGRNIQERGLSREEADFLLANDIQSATDDLNETLPWTSQLDWPRRSVLINMVFQMGIDRVLGFKEALNALEIGDWRSAHDALLDSKWARDDSPARAIDEAKVILTGELPEAD
jgi:lysozyme